MGERKRGRPVTLGLLRAIARLPLPVLHGLGAMAGAAVDLRPNRQRQITESNLALCFPELSHRERARLRRRSLVETGKTMTESLALWLADGERVLTMVKGVSGKAAVDAAMAAGKGVILAGPHLGAWEMVGLYASAHWPITSLYRPPRTAIADAIMHSGRERLGATLVPTDASGVRRLLQALRRGRMAGILPDQDPHDPQGLFAPFFGIPANTMSLLSRLAAKSGAPVFVVYAERLPRGGGYHMHFIPAGPEVNDPDPERSSAALNRAVEAAVRACPAQYQWSYKRFRTRPPGEHRIYRRNGLVDRESAFASRVPEHLTL